MRNFTRSKNDANKVTNEEPLLTAEQVINLSLVVARIDKARVDAPLLETQTLRASRRGAMLFFET